MEHQAPALLGNIKHMQESFKSGGVEIMRLVYDIPELPTAQDIAARTERAPAHRQKMRSSPKDAGDTAHSHTVKLIETLAEVVREEILAECEESFLAARTAGTAYRFARYTCKIGCREAREGYCRRIEVSFSITAGREILHSATCTMLWNADGTAQRKGAKSKKRVK